MNKRIIKTKTLKFGGEDRQYEVVDKNLGVDYPRWFIAYNKGIPFISDEVPEEYTEPMVFHELYEFEILPPDKVCRCLEALREELRTIPQENRGKYMEFRRRVFESLVEFLERNGESFLPEVRRSLEYLKKYK